MGLICLNKKTEQPISVAFRGAASFFLAPLTVQGEAGELRVMRAKQTNPSPIDA